MSQSPTARLMDGSGLARRIVEESADARRRLAGRTADRPVPRDRAGRRGPGFGHVRPDEAGPLPQGRHRVAARRPARRRRPPPSWSRPSPRCRQRPGRARHPAPAPGAGRTSTSAPRSRPSRPSKDVDGVTMHSFAAMSLRRCPASSPARPAASCGCWTRTTSSSPASTPSSSAAAPILGKPVGMLLLAATRR